MTKFEDGPAAGVVLALRRAAYLLRVVQGADGKWDALDQPGDVPAADEKVFVYGLVSNDGGAFIDGRGKDGKRFGFYAVSATYRLFPTQPDDATARDADAWLEWQKARYKDMDQG